MIKDSFAIIEILELHLQDLRFFLDEGRPLSAVRAAAHGHGLLDPREHRTLPVLATRGKPRRLHADVRQAIIDLPREHSRKPDCVYGRIERLVPGPYLECRAAIARRWDSWGDQTGKFDEKNTATAASATLARTDFSPWDAP